MLATSYSGSSPYSGLCFHVAGLTALDPKENDFDNMLRCVKELKEGKSVMKPMYVTNSLASCTTLTVLARNLCRA